MSYWSVTHSRDEWAGYAEALDGDPVELAARLRDGMWQTEWTPPRLELVEGEIVDYLDCDLPLRLCSLRLRGLIQARRRPADRFQWLPVKVGELDYAALHVLASRMWIDVGHSRFEGGELTVPVVNRELAGERCVLAPKGDLVAWLVDDALCEELEEARVTGVEFYEVEAV